jgi:hypothetical protein
MNKENAVCIRILELKKLFVLQKNSFYIRGPEKCSERV